MSVNNDNNGVRLHLQFDEESNNHVPSALNRNDNPLRTRLHVHCEPKSKQVQSVFDQTIQQQDLLPYEVKKVKYDHNKSLDIDSEIKALYKELDKRCNSTTNDDQSTTDNQSNEKSNVSIQSNGLAANAKYQKFDIDQLGERHTFFSNSPAADKVSKCRDIQSVNNLIKETIEKKAENKIDQREYDRIMHKCGQKIKYLKNTANQSTSTNSSEKPSTRQKNLLDAFVNHHTGKKRNRDS